MDPKLCVLALSCFTWCSLAMASGRLRLQLFGFFLDQLGLFTAVGRRLLATESIVLSHGYWAWACPSCPASEREKTGSGERWFLGDSSRLMKMRIRASATPPAGAKVNWRKKAPTSGGGDEERRI